MRCALALLEAGWRVRGTMRDSSRAEWLRGVLAEHVELDDRFELVAADLADDRGWLEAVRGCEYVLHVASPVPAAVPDDPEEVIGPARDGTLRVLRAASKTGVRRVVLTSSTAAIFWGHPRDGKRVHDESDWTILNDDVGPYERSKTIAERAAWDFVGALPENERFELVAMNPGAILGPVLDKDFSVSGEIVRKLMARELPGCPDLGWAVCDVRDVAAAHVAAMTSEHTAGKRFILASEHVPMHEIAEVLARHFGPRGYKVPTGRVPSFVIKLLGLWDKTTRMAARELGKRHDVSTQRARSLLGWEPRTVESMVVDMAESMIRCGALPAR